MSSRNIQMETIEEDQVELYSVDYTDHNETELRYRSIAVENNTRSQSICSGMREMESGYMASKPSMMSLKVEKCGLMPISGTAPSEPPFGLSNSKFTVSNSNHEEVEKRIGNYLGNCSGFDFSHFPTDHMWKGKYLDGACCIEIDVRLYYEKKCGLCTIAVFKMKGGNSFGGVSFRDFYSKFQEEFCGEVQESKKRKMQCLSQPSTSFLMSMVAPPTADEFLTGMRSVFRMTQEGTCMESRVEAAKMLCEVSKKDASYLEIPSFSQDCVIVLEALLKDSFEEVRQHATMAIYNLVNLSSYQQLLVQSTEFESGIVATLFAAIENAVIVENSWETVKARRTSAAILAMLSRSYPVELKAQLGLEVEEDELNHWATSIVPSLHDAQMREYALIIVHNCITNKEVVSIVNSYSCIGSGIKKNSLYSDLKISAK